MLTSFLMSFIFVCGLFFLIWCFIHLLTVEKEPWKNNKWFTAGEYRRLSTKDKLKYHKYKGDIVEKLDLKYPLSALIEIKYKDSEILYRIKKEDGNEFTLGEFTKLSFENPRYASDIIKIYYKLNDDKSLELSVFSHDKACVLINIDHERVAFVSDYDNIIEWENLVYRDEIIQVLKKLDINLEEKLIL